MKTQLKSTTLSPYIQKFYFEDHQAGYEKFKKQFKGNPVADFVTPDLIPQTFWVNLKNPSQSEVLIETLSSLAGVQSVVDQRSYLDQIFSILNAASYTAIGIAALMLVAAALLIATTIRLSAFSRRRELGIMRLVGASNRFIQTPFVLEGVFAALIGSVLAAGAVVRHRALLRAGYLANRIMLDQLRESRATRCVVVPILLLVGVVLAALSANFAITRYLKV